MHSNDKEQAANQHDQQPQASRHSEVPTDEALDQVLNKNQQSTTPSSGGQAEGKLQEAEREILRVRAELENFRKRMQRETDQQLKYANVPLVRDLVDVVDNLKRAAEAANSDASNTEALRNGVELVTQQLLSVLTKYGCKPIDSVGTEFDPNVHEAIAQMPSEEFAAGMVAQEVALGYLLHDRVVRPSTVIVSTGPAN
jgi:molecular chaperone GrpE